MRKIPVLVPLVALASPAAATEDRLELWLNPSATVAIDEATFVELETAQRFRGALADDTYYARLWLGREVADGVTLSAGAERRYEGDGHETRLLQQVAYPLGPLSGRTRLEQRFLSEGPQTAWRLRQRIGGALPLSGDDGWELVSNAEAFFTLHPSEPGTQTGLTGLRSFIGVEREFFGRVELSVGYLRQQTIRENAPDTIGHAPFLGLGLSF